MSDASPDITPVDPEVTEIEPIKRERSDDLPLPTKTLPETAWVIEGPKLYTHEQARNVCAQHGERLPSKPIAGLENYRYFLADGRFVRMNAEIGEADPGGIMVGWVVCEP